MLAHISHRSRLLGATMSPDRRLCFRLPHATVQTFKVDPSRKMSSQNSFPGAWTCACSPPAAQPPGDRSANSVAAHDKVFRRFRNRAPSGRSRRPPAVHVAGDAIRVRTTYAHERANVKFRESGITCAAFTNAIVPDVARTKQIMHALQSRMLRNRVTVAHHTRVVLGGAARTCVIDLMTSFASRNGQDSPCSSDRVGRRPSQLRKD